MNIDDVMVVKLFRAPQTLLREAQQNVRQNNIEMLRCTKKTTVSETDPILHDPFIH
jgi:hypothetical protein